MLKTATLKLLTTLDNFTEWTGRIIAWLTLLMVLVVILVLALRNWFDLSAIALQESVSYMHAVIFMLGAAFALKHNDHVRVDVFYQHCSLKMKAIINMLGFSVLLLPVCLFIFIYCKDYVLFNWALKEESNQPGGLPFLYLLKTLLLAMPVTLIIQGFSDFLKCFSFLAGWLPAPDLLNATEQQLEEEQLEEGHHHA